MSNVFKNIHNLPIDKAVEILDKNISGHVQVVYIQNSFSKHISSIVILVLQKKQGWQHPLKQAKFWNDMTDEH